MAQHGVRFIAPQEPGIDLVTCFDLDVITWTTSCSRKRRLPAV